MNLFRLAALTTVLLGVLPAVAGSPPASCTNIPGCPLTTDLVKFGEGLAGGVEIDFRIIDCTTCAGPANAFQLGAVLAGEFGPYTTGTCGAGDDLVTLDTNALLPFFQQGTTLLPEQSYVPLDGNQSFVPSLIADLRPACVDSGGADPNLDYEIRRMTLTGGGGAVTSGLFNNRPRLSLPLSVRSSDGLQLVLSHFNFRQDLSFSHLETEGPASSLRFWPDGLPFRIGPNDITYQQDRVSFTTPDLPLGPQAYAPAPPGLSNIPLDPNLSLVSCMAYGDACNDGTALINGGYFLNDFWVPANAAFDAGGIDVDLSLGAAHLVTYEPAFPRGLKLTLNGSASIEIVDGDVTSGDFFGGTAFYRYEDGICITSTLPVYTELTRSLNTAPFAPELLPGGALLAGVSDLNQLGEALTWTYNEASALECGTLFVPPVQADKERDSPGVTVGPQYEWLAAADLFDPDADKIDGRGVYAGVNYNRDGMCVGGALDGILCTADKGCDVDVGVDGTCDVGRWSPKCPALTLGTTPTWSTGIQNINPKLDTTIVPGDDNQFDREMALLIRESGVSGVFDGGNDGFTFNPPGGFDFAFDSFGWAFLDSRSCAGDTITDGGLNFAWPTDEAISFADLKFCDCGALKSTRPTESLIEHTLGYWDAAFFPYTLYFSREVDGDCENLGSSACTEDAFSAASTACIDAITPIQHFKPDPLSTFGLKPDGQISNGGIIGLKADTDFRFEEPIDQQLESYVVHMERARLSEWDGATENAVVQGQHNYGCYDLKGDAILPYYGETAMGAKVQKAAAIDSHHSASAHKQEAAALGPLCNATEQAIPGSRPMGADCIDPAPEFLLPASPDDRGGRRRCRPGCRNLGRLRQPTRRRWRRHRGRRRFRGGGDSDQYRDRGRQHARGCRRRRAHGALRQDPAERRRRR